MTNSYRTTKCTLDDVLRQPLDRYIILDAVIRTHRLTIHAYQFLRLWILHKHQQDQVIPHIDHDLIRMVFYALKTSSNGPTPSGNQAKLLQEFNEFYEKEYKELGYSDKINSVKLPQILKDAATEMVTAIENNIKNHFFTYLLRFVNSSFAASHQQKIDEIKDPEEQDTLRLLFRKKLDTVKKDLINNTFESDPSYHSWIRQHRPHIFPPNHQHSDIKADPQKYLKNMIYMCTILETNKAKMFQWFPLRTSIIPGYIHLDSIAIRELFRAYHHKGKVEEYRDKLWDQYFKIRKFERTNYTFDYRISTDGVAVSVQLLNHEQIKPRQEKKTKMVEGKAKTREMTKNMTPEEKEQYIVQKKRQLLKEQTEKRRQAVAEMKKRPGAPRNEESLYLEDLNDDELDALLVATKVYVDPGKGTLLRMLSDDGKTFKYTNKEHLRRTKRFKYQAKIEKYKRREKIFEIERALSNFNSKSCDYEQFKAYLKIKNTVNAALFRKYESPYFRRYRWYGYLDRKRTEDHLVNNITKTFGEDAVLIYGDWSVGKQMRNFISTPNIGLKRKLGKHFQIYSIDEFRTSRLHHQNEEVCGNLRVRNEDGKTWRSVHSVLTFQTENHGTGCINRDNNAVLNMRKLTHYFLEHGDRPLRYRRGYDLTTNSAGNLRADVVHTSPGGQIER